MEQVRLWVPPEREEDLVYFDVPNTKNPLGFNPLGGVPQEGRALAASNLVEVFKKYWSDSWGPRLEYLLRNTLVALLDQENATLADVPRLLSDDKFRRWVCHKVSNPDVRAFWLREYEGWPSRFRAEAIAPLQNKVGAFLTNPVLRNIVTQPKSAFDPRELMDSGKILLVNLAKGRIGEDSAGLLGALLVSRLGIAALGRADSPAENRPPFFLYLDEFQTFTTLSLANMLSELRKYGVGMVLAHQYLSQLDPEVRDAILGNVGTLAALRVGPEDAEALVGEFKPEVSEQDLVNLPNHEMYVRLMVDGVVSRPFSGTVLRQSSGGRPEIRL